MFCETIVMYTYISYGLQYNTYFYSAHIPTQNFLLPIETNICRLFIFLSVFNLNI